jgi:uncharacterized protein GlcG (DUF336 family)
MTQQITSLTLADARALIAAAEKKALEIEIPYNIAVVDSAGLLIAQVRMDGAWRGSINISIDKAYSARAFDMSTSDLARAAQSGGSLFGINTTNDSRVVIFGGGVPVRVNGTVVGAVGASGGSVENDIEVAEAAVAAFAATGERFQ